MCESERFDLDLLKAKMAAATRIDLVAHFCYFQRQGMEVEVSICEAEMRKRLANEEEEKQPAPVE